MFVILMATYNGEKYISAQIESILAQTFKDWHIIVRDDGSDDRTLEILWEYKKRYETKIDIYVNDTYCRGVLNNFNELLKLAPKADYYLYCDQDDIWKENKLEVLYFDFMNLKKNIPKMIYHDAKVVDAKLNIINESFFEYTGLNLDGRNKFQALLLMNYVPGCCIAMDSLLMNRIKDDQIHVGMHDWWTSLVAAGVGEIYYERKKLILYRQHENNCIGAICSKRTVKNVMNSIRKIKKLKSDAREYNMELFKRYIGELHVSKLIMVKENIRAMSNKRNGVKEIFINMKRGNMLESVIKTIVYWKVKI